MQKHTGRNGHDDKQASSGIGQQGNHRGDTSATDKVLIYSWWINKLIIFDNKLMTNLW